MGSPSLQPGQFDTNLQWAIEKEGGFAGIGLTSSILATIMTSADFMSLFPVGAVMMWADADTIPENWGIIDNSVGAYPLGIAAGTAFVTSGSATHGHSDHIFTQPTAHPQTTPSTGNPNTTSGDVQPGTGAAVANYLHGHQTTIPAVSHTGGAVDPHSTASNSPPSFNVFFIHKYA